jgi:Protein of unknown function (DUF1449)
MELWNIAISAPVLPATLLMCLMLGWAVLILMGSVDLHHSIHLPDADVDLPVDGAIPHSGNGASEVLTSGKTGFSILALRWLNLSGVPIIVWACVFTIIWWTFSALAWVTVDSKLFEDPGNFWSTVLVIRNLIVALFLTKVVTNPLKRAFNFEASVNAPQSLIGKECEISSSEATPDFGLVKFPTGGAPLLLNVRTDGVHLPKGTPVWITHYDEKRRVYIVSPTTTKKQI